MLRYDSIECCASMAVPDFQAMMLPLLELVSDGSEYRFRDVIGSVSDRFELSEEDRAETISSGPLKINNRVGWATTHLSKAGLIERPRHGYLKITERGLALLKENVGSIDLKLLDRYPEHIEFRKGSKKNNSKSAANTTTDVESQTPSEIMDETYKTIRDNLADELLSQVKSCSPGFFEKLVVDVLIAMGYGGTRPDAAGEVIGKSGDGGIDGTIKEDRLGLDVIYVQAKRWENTVQKPHIQQFAGALQGQKARKGVFITTSGFSQGAREYARNIESSLVLVDGIELAGLMIDHNVGVSLANSYEIKRIDSDYFDEV